ncbi:hypothetical protein MMC10_001602 [Thelotrema lepadinum]|nr:hypothetical protein [Thelotrema lepadinum]
MAESGKKDIVVIGGGIIGCTTAYFLTRHPSYDPSKHKITLLEASKIAGGASGKAGGLLALWAYPSSIVPLSFRLHAELAAEHDGATRWGYRRVHCGQLSAKGRVSSTNGSTKPKSKSKDETISLQKRDPSSLGRLRAAGIPSDLDWFSADCVRDYSEMGFPDNTAQVHPYQFTTSMASLAAENGATILTNSLVTSINYTSSPSSPSSSASVESVTYTSPSSPHPVTLPTTDLILAAGPWTATLLPSAPIAGLRAHSITIRPARPISAYAVFTEISLPPSPDPHDGIPVAKHVSPEIYARPNNEAYACGEGDTLVPLPKTTEDVETDLKRCQDIVDQVGAISEELRDGEVLVRQACYLPNVTGDVSGPLVGPTGTKGLWMAAGHTCWGIQNGPGTGRVVSEMVFEGKSRSAKVGGLDPRKVL